jgi:ribosome biogenesis GTPase / thiamine phosphate phosphatase
LPNSTKEALGWGEPFEAAFAEYAEAGFEAGRVAVEHRNRYVVLTGTEEIDARLAGRMRIALHASGERPVVGDWVVFKRGRDGAATIHARLPRRSQFSRKVAGRTVEEQVMAANVDTVFLATSLNSDLNPRRLERYLLLAWESGAQPVVLLTKADLAPDNAEQVRTEFERVTQGVPVHIISSRTGSGIAELEHYLIAGHTIAVLGSSGVGKSTLINRLLGTDQMKTAEIRNDGRGRHTTTYRELVRLPSGALIIDTPGLRELQLWEADSGLQEAFAEIDQLAEQCRFTDCQHRAEPGCAVTEAVQSGALSVERLDSYQQLRRELKHIEDKSDVRARAERNRNNRVLDKAAKKRLKEKGY